MELDPAEVHVGEPVRAVVHGCAAPSQVAAAWRLTRVEGKGWPPPLPIDLAGADLAPTADGVAFTVVPRDARSWIGVAVDCSDGTRYATDGHPVTVYPPPDELWFRSPYGRWDGTAGTTAEVAVSSLDCAEGSTGAARLTGAGTPAIETTEVFGADSPRTAVFALVLAPDTVPGPRSLTVGCTTAGGSTITDTVPFTVFPAQPDDGGQLVPTGSGPPAVTMAAASVLVAAGLALGALAGVGVRRTARR